MTRTEISLLIMYGPIALISLLIAVWDTIAVRHNRKAGKHQ